MIARAAVSLLVATFIGAADVHAAKDDTPANLLPAQPAPAPPAPAPETVEHRWYGGTILLAAVGVWGIASAVTKNTSDLRLIAPFSLAALAIGPTVHLVYGQPRNFRRSLVYDAVLVALGAVAGPLLCSSMSGLGDSSAPGSSDGCLSPETVLFGVVAVGLGAPIWDAILIAWRPVPVNVSFVPMGHGIGLSAAGRF